jgi:hypothetical protein
MIGKGSALQLAVGDQFYRVEDPDTVWTVQRVVDRPKLPKHAVMTCEQPAHRRIMVSAAVLRDKRMYRHVPAAQPAGKAEGLSRLGLGWLFGR